MLIKVQIFQQFNGELANYTNSELYLLVFINIIGYNIIYHYTIDAMNSIQDIDRAKLNQIDGGSYFKNGLKSMGIDGSNYKGAYGTMSKPLQESRPITVGHSPSGSLKADSKELLEGRPTPASGNSPHQFQRKVSDFQLKLSSNEKSGDPSEELDLKKTNSDATLSHAESKLPIANEAKPEVGPSKPRDD